MVARLTLGVLLAGALRRVRSSRDVSTRVLMLPKATSENFSSVAMTVPTVVEPFITTLSPTAGGPSCAAATRCAAGFFLGRGAPFW